MSALTAMPVQRKVFEATTRNGESNRFIRTGKYIRFADWRFVHLAHLDVFPLNRARRWGTGDRRSRRCGYTSEPFPTCSATATLFRPLVNYDTMHLSRGLPRPPGSLAKFG